MHFSIDRTVHTTAFDKPVVDHWLERKIAQTAAGSTEKDRSDDRPLQRRARYRLSYIPLPCSLSYTTKIRGRLSYRCRSIHVAQQYLRQLRVTSPSDNEEKKEGNVIFNDALNTFYLRLYGVRHMVKDHSDSERKPAAATWATLFD